MSNSASEAQISLQLTPNTQNQKYGRLIPDDIQHIFLYGDSIQGTVNIRLLKAEKLSHKGITVKIVRHCYNGSSIIGENILFSQCLAKKGKIRSDMTSYFRFENVNIDGETYIGKKYSIQYSVVVTISRSIVSDITCATRFAYLKPIVPPKNNDVITLAFNKPELVIEVELRKSVFSRDEVMRGRLLVDRMNPHSIAKVYLQIVLIDCIQDKIGKGNDRIVCSYELLDGTPRPGILAPFVIQLAPLELWSSSADDSAPVQIQYRVDLVVIKADGQKHVTSHGIIIYQEHTPDP